MIKVGDSMPSLTLRTMGKEGPETLTTTDFFAEKRAVLFGVPGAFTPGCSRQHLPGYLAHLQQFASLNIDTVACVAVNDPFVLQAWAEKFGATGKITMLSDEGELRDTFGLSLDLSAIGLGKRIQRFAMALDNNIVTVLAIEPDRQIVKSSAEEMYKILSERSSSSV